jgi:hypothetical protein
MVGIPRIPVDTRLRRSDTPTQAEKTNPTTLARAHAGPTTGARKHHTAKGASPIGNPLKGPRLRKAVGINKVAPNATLGRTLRGSCHRTAIPAKPRINIRALGTASAAYAAKKLRNAAPRIQSLAGRMPAELMVD